jgi:hypothetical protein
MVPRSTLLVLSVCMCLVVAIPIAQAQGITQPKQGQGGSVVKGAAGPNGSTGDNGLEHCDKPMGALAVVEPQSQVLTALMRYKLQSPVGLIRLMVQQSNCFIVVERGAGMQNMMQERQLAASGQAREGSNLGGGQMVAADFILTPSVVFSENNAGSVGSAASTFMGGKLGAIAGGLKFKEAQTSMLVADSRSGVQVAAAEGSTKKADLRLGGLLVGGSGGVGAGGYGNTNEGKIIAAAFMDNYNNVVKVVRNDPSLQRSVGTLKEEAAAGGKTKAAFNEGDVLVPKIPNIKLLADASDSAKTIATLARGEELVVTGGEKDGFIQVQGANGAGWVKIVLVQKR